MFGCGAAVVSGINYIGTSLAFGLVFIAMAYTIGNVSGCHINPAVSLAMTFTGKMKIKECVEYVFAQIFGAIAGSAILGVIVNSFANLGANSYDTNYFNCWIALLVEFILTFVFVLTVLCVTAKKDNGHASGVIIGLTLTLVHLFGLPFTGTSVNPARSIGPALLQSGNAINQIWVFILAPCVGAVAAAYFYKYIIKK